MHRLVFYPQMNQLIEVHGNGKQSLLREKCDISDARALAIELEIKLYIDFEDGRPLALVYELK